MRHEWRRVAATSFTAVRIPLKTIGTVLQTVSQSTITACCSPTFADVAAMFIFREAIFADLPALQRAALLVVANLQRLRTCTGVATVRILHESPRTVHHAVNLWACLVS